MPEKRPATVYVDAFNLYYGARDSCDPIGVPFRWLDLKRLFEIVVPEAEIERIRYFTANLKPHDSAKARRQRAYLRALRTIEELTIHKGEYRQDIVSMPLSDGSGMADVVKNEEKGSDVNLATYLMLDALVDGSTPLAIVVSNDSDLRRPIQIVVERGLEVGVLNPHVTYPLGVFRTVASWVRPIRPGAYGAAQLPPNVPTGNGEHVTKPGGW